MPVRSRRKSATTRTRTRHDRPYLSLGPDHQLLEPAQEIVSPETGMRYETREMIGRGGYGQVYLAKRLGRSKEIPRDVCIKISPHIDAWLREAYFGQLLDKHPRAIRVFDKFPWMQPPGKALYCLVLEYATHGDLSTFLFRTRTAWAETTSRREIAGILQVLGKLHRGQLLHRDLTPLNVFVCDNRRLKLGDFGIVRQQSGPGGITARTMNALTAPVEILLGTVPKWQARDDVYQVGQLLGMLIRGDAQSRLRPMDVRGLACSGELKEIIYRCIGERRKRYVSADELVAALKTPHTPLKIGALRSLKGVHLAFTGIFDLPRREVVAAAKRAGAHVHEGPSAKTTVVVRGRPNPRQAAGQDGGLKLMEIKRLREKGRRIILLDEARFWRLADPPSTPGKRRPK